MKYTIYIKKKKKSCFTQNIVFIHSFIRRICCHVCSGPSLLEIIVSGRPSNLTYTNFISSAHHRLLEKCHFLSSFITSFFDPFTSSLFLFLFVLCLHFSSHLSFSSLSPRLSLPVLPRHHLSLNSLSWTHTGGFCHRWVYDGALHCMALPASLIPCSVMPAHAHLPNYHQHSMSTNYKVPLYVSQCVVLLSRLKSTFRL